MGAEEGSKHVLIRLDQGKEKRRVCFLDDSNHIGLVVPCVRNEDSFFFPLRAGKYHTRTHACHDYNRNKIYRM